MVFNLKLNKKKELFDCQLDGRNQACSQGKNVFEIRDISKEKMQIWYSRTIKILMVGTKSDILKLTGPQEKLYIGTLKQENNQWLWRKMRWETEEMPKPKAVFWPFHAIKKSKTSYKTEEFFATIKTP